MLRIEGVPAPLSPLGAVVRGTIAAAAGTAAMDVLWYRRYRRAGGQDGFLAWETAKGLDSWEAAPAPAKVGMRLVGGFLGRDIPPSQARLLTNAVHWAYGMGAGAAYGIGAGTLGPRRVYLGPPFGAAVWASSYVALPLAGVYKPIWEYDLPALCKDLSAHLLFGTVTGLTFAALSLR